MTGKAVELESTQTFGTLATMVRTPNEGGDVNGIGFVCLCTSGVEVSDFVRFLCFGGVVLPLELTVFVEDVYPVFIFLYNLDGLVLWIEITIHRNLGNGVAVKNVVVLFLTVARDIGRRDVITRFERAIDVGHPHRTFTDGVDERTLVTVLFLYHSDE